MTQSHLESEIREYGRAAGETERRLDAHARERYGIEGASRILDEWICPAKDFTVCLARQVVAASTEQLAFSILGAQLGRDMPCDWVIPPFVSDSYGRHKYKESLLKIPELAFDAAGGCTGVKKIDLISKARRQELFNGLPPVLRDIVTDAGVVWGERRDAKPLPDFHADLWKCATGVGPPPCNEAGDFHRRLLISCMEAQSTGKPPYFFVEEEGRSRKVDMNEWNGLPERLIATARPPAQWYYFFYLSLFVTGKRALFASLDDDKDVHAMFQVMTEIEEVTGRKPLIVPIPYKHQHDKCMLYFNEMNPTLMNGKAWPAVSTHDARKDAGIFDRMLDLELRLSERFPE